MSPSCHSQCLRTEMTHIILARQVEYYVVVRCQCNLSTSLALLPLSRRSSIRRIHYDTGKGYLQATRELFPIWGNFRVPSCEINYMLRSRA
jgi:hypothetical protein